MPEENLLHVGMTHLSPIRVAHKLCVFPDSSHYPFRKIQATFQVLREWAVNLGLNPDTLLHIGIPVHDGKAIVTYGCCLEFPLPFEDKRKGIGLKSLSGGAYAVLRIEKTPGEISKAIRQFHGDYIPDHLIIIDESRPVYEYYYEDTMEYCVPVIELRP